MKDFKTAKLKNMKYLEQNGSKQIKHHFGNRMKKRKKNRKRQKGASLLGLHFNNPFTDKILENCKYTKQKMARNKSLVHTLYISLSELKVRMNKRPQ